MVAQSEGFIVLHEKVIVKVAWLDHADLGPFGEEPENNSDPSEDDDGDNDDLIDVGLRLVRVGAKEPRRNSRIGL